MKALYVHGVLQLRPHNEPIIHGIYGDVERRVPSIPCTTKFEVVQDDHRMTAPHGTRQS